METTTLIDKRSIRRARCEFCGGKGADLQVELVTNPAIGRSFLVPLSHGSCKESILSLSRFTCR
jgi:hypothetical protein